MKIFKNKKVIVALVALVAAVAIAVSSALLTIAYLTSSAAVSNVFTIGNVGIAMTESKVNPDGEVVKDGEGKTTQVDTNTYHLIPDKTYTKDPRITVKEGSVDSYLFVLVRNDIEAIEAEGESTIAHQLAANGWAKYTRASTGWVYVYVGFTTDGGNTVTKVPAADVTAKDQPTLDFTQTTFPEVKEGEFILFESFSIASDANISAYGAAKVTLTAVAIQKEGFSTLADAWAAVVATYPYIHTGSN